MATTVDKVYRQCTHTAIFTFADITMFRSRILRPRLEEKECVLVAHAHTSSDGQDPEEQGYIFPFRSIEGKACKA